MTNGEKMQEVFPEGKTRRCRDGVVFESDGWCHAYGSDWWSAEYKEPTTKKCTTCAYREINGKPHEMCKSCVCGDRYKEEPTTKNDLGVDCISRQSVLDKIQRLVNAEQNNIDENGDYMNYARERVNAYEAIQFFVENDCLCPSVTPQEPKWIPVGEKLPETDDKNSINKYNVLLWVKDKNDPKDEPQIYLGKLRHIDGDDGSGNFWGIKTEPCEWTIWGWSYFREPEVIAWQPLPEPYKAESEE